MKPHRKPDVLLAGATGLIGNILLKLLLNSDEFKQIHVLARRDPGIKNSRIILHLTDLDQMEDVLTGIKVETVFCGLGTTMHQAGSAEAFRKVDFEYPKRLALVMKENGARQYLLVSSIGADPHSRVFYTKVKGETEQAIRDSGFETTLIFRPSLLLGPREEFRLGESIGKIIMPVISPLLAGPLKRYRPIQAEAVAAAMIHAALQSAPGIHVFESDDITGLLKQ